MTLIAELRLDSPILRASLSAVPEMRLTYLQQTVADGEARLIFRAAGDDFGTFETAMADDPTVAEYARLTDTAGRRLYRVTVTGAASDRLTYPDAVTLDAPILDAGATADGWSVRMEFPDREALCAYHDACDERGVSFEVRSLYGGPNSDGDDATRLTPVQREVLEVALDRGYFEIPRHVSLNDLGEQLGISGQAVSERLRRALGKAALAALRYHESPNGDM